MNRRRTLVTLLVAASLSGCSTGPGWQMPDVVGVDLQAAQDTVQVLTGFQVPVTTHDRTGAARTQVLDVEWRVCSQTPDAGTDISPGSMVDLGVVRWEEDC